MRTVVRMIIVTILVLRACSLIFDGAAVALEVLIVRLTR